MPRFQWLLVAVLLGNLHAPQTLAQTVTDPGVLKFTHTLESSRVEALETSRQEVANRFLAVADEILLLPEPSGRLRLELLGEALYLADSIAALDREILEAGPAVKEARRNLISALEAQVTTLSRAAEAAADPARRPALETQIGSLEAELGELRELENPDDKVDPLSSASPTLAAFAGVVIGERASLRTRKVLQDEVRLFLGNLRLFDETGLPPSVRSESGGETDPGCGISTCSTDPASSPADLPFEYFAPEGGADEKRVAVSLSSLTRLQEQLAALTNVGEVPGEDSSWDHGPVIRETVVGVGHMSFRGQEDGRSGLGLKAGTSFLFSRALGSSMQATVEPWLGVRSVQLYPGSAVEVAGEIRETLVGAFGDRQTRWQVTAWQKGRFLSEQLPQPAYLEPGRLEGGLTSRVAIHLFPSWELEAGGGGDAVRYEPEEWRALDRRGLNASVAIARRGESGSARISLLGSCHRFALDGGIRRRDTRMGLGADWALEGKALLRLSMGVAWNNSRLPAYDYRSGRAVAVISAPCGRGTILAYGAFAHKSYLNPGPENARIAPSDQDTGSIVALQFTRPLDATHALTLRAEWSRSETGFRNDFYQRFGTSIQLNFRGLGES